MTKKNRKIGNESICEGVRPIHTSVEATVVLSLEGGVDAVELS